MAGVDHAAGGAQDDDAEAEAGENVVIARCRGRSRPVAFSHMATVVASSGKPGSVGFSMPAEWKRLMNSHQPRSTSGGPMAAISQSDADRLEIGVERVADPGVSPISRSSPVGRLLVDQPRKRRVEHRIRRPGDGRFVPRKPPVPSIE